MTDAALDSRFPICIVAVGARSPLGLTAPATAAAVRAAVSAVAAHRFLVDRGGEPVSVAVDSELGLDVAGVDRLAALLLPAIDEALSPLSSLGAHFTPTPLVLGLPEPRPGLPPEFANALADRLVKNERRLRSVQTLPHGHAAGLMALEECAKQLKAGRTEFALVAGVDSYLDADTLDWLDDSRQLMSDRNRSGFPPGEAAGVCLLATARTAVKHRLPPLARLVSTGAAKEAQRIKTDAVCIGAGLTEAIRQAIAPLNPDEKIDFTYCDINGERYRSEEFTFAILRTQKAFVDGNDFLTPADCWGDIGAASGPIHCVLAIESGRRRYAKGPRILVWGGSEGGDRSAAVLHLPVEPTTGGRS